MKNVFEKSSSPIRRKVFFVVLILTLLLSLLGLTSIFASASLPPSDGSKNNLARMTATPVLPAPETLLAKKSPPFTVHELKAAADVEKPILSWVSPTTDGKIWEVTSGQVTLTVLATDNIGVARVNFTRWDAANEVMIDLGNDTSSPYSINLDSSTLNPGWNQVNAVAYDAAGNSSNFKYIWIYRNSTIPTTPITISPAGNITTTRPAYVWSYISGAVSYKLAVYDVSIAKYVIITTANSSQCSTTTKKCTITPSTSLTMNKNYKWKVLATDNTGISSPYSAFKSFKPGMPVPVTYTPSSAISTLKPAYIWSRVAGATKYKLAVYHIDSASYVVVDLVSSSYCSTTTNKCTYTPSSTLVLNNDYKWKVLSINAANLPGPYSAFKPFKPSIPIPVTYSPSGNITSVKPAYVWSRVNVAASYRLYVYDIAAAKYLLIATVSNSVCSTTTNKCTYTPSTTLALNKEYKWKVLATTATDLSSPHSEFMNFKVISK